MKGEVEMSDKRKYIVITGSSAGIGRSAAEAFAKRGKNLILVARRKARLEELRNKLLSEHPEIDVIFKVYDLSLPQNVYNFYNELKLEGLCIETWINNAGIGQFGRFIDLDIEKQQNTIHLNVEATTIFSALFVKDHFNVPGSQLINISSAGGYLTLPEQIVYCASKSYICAFTEGLIHEVRMTNAAIKVKLFAPSATKTEFDGLAIGNPDHVYEKGRDKFQTSEEVAELLVQLYESDMPVGRVTRGTFEYNLVEPQLPFAIHMKAVSSDAFPEK